MTKIFNIYDRCDVAGLTIMIQSMHRVGMKNKELLKSLSDFDVDIELQKTHFFIVQNGKRVKGCYK